MHDEFVAHRKLVSHDGSPHFSKKNLSMQDLEAAAITVLSSFHYKHNAQTSRDATHIVKPQSVQLTTRHMIYKREDKSLTFPQCLHLSSAANKGPYHPGYRPPGGLWYCRFCVRKAFRCRDSLRKHCRLQHTDVWSISERFWQYTEDEHLPTFR